jgi:hypothetical protein
MPRLNMGIRHTGPTRTAPIPEGRDPFVNTPLLRLTPGRDGRDRFWISTWNSAVGCLGVCIDETGNYRVYRFRSHRLPGFYSAVQTDDDILWLCGRLSTVVRLDLASGKYDACETGAPDALVFQGMAYDPATGKLVAAAFPPPKTIGFSFDQFGAAVRGHVDLAAQAPGPQDFAAPRCGAPAVETAAGLEVGFPETLRDERGAHDAVAVGADNAVYGLDAVGIEPKGKVQCAGPGIVARKEPVLVDADNLARAC